MNRENIQAASDRILRGALIAHLFIMSIPHTAALQSILFGLCILSLIIKSVVTRKNPFHRTQLDYILLVYVVLCVVKSVFSIDTHYSMDEITGELLQQILIFYFVTCSMNNEKYVGRLLVTMILSMFVVSSVGMLGYFYDMFMKNGRATSYFGSFGIAAFYTSMIFPIALGKFLNSRKWIQTVVLGICMIVAVTFMIMTLSRGAWISTLAALFLLTALKDRRMLVVLLIVVIIIPWFLPSNVLDRAFSIFEIKKFKDTAVFGDRWWMWKSAVDMIHDRPILGAGYGNRNFFRLYPRYIYSESSGMIYYNAHNLYLQTAVEMGLAGLVVFMVLLLSPLVLIYRRMKMRINLQTESYLLGIAGSFLVFLIFSATTYRYESNIGFLFWYLMGCVCVLTRSREHPEDLFR